MQQDEVFLKINSIQDDTEKFALSTIYSKQFPNLAFFIQNHLLDIYNIEMFEKHSVYNKKDIEQIDMITKALTELGAVKLNEVEQPQEGEVVKYTSEGKIQNILYHFMDKQNQLGLTNANLQKTLKREEALIPLFLLTVFPHMNTIHITYKDYLKLNQETYKGFTKILEDCMSIQNAIYWDNLHPDFKAYFKRRDIAFNSISYAVEDLYLDEVQTEFTWVDFVLREATFRAWIADETDLTEMLYLMRLNRELDSSAVKIKIAEIETKLLNKMFSLKEVSEKSSLTLLKVFKEYIEKKN